MTAGVGPNNAIKSSDLATGGRLHPEQGGGTKKPPPKGRKG